MRRQIVGPLLVLVALLASLPAQAQTTPSYPSDVSACTKSGTTITCNAQLHEFSGGFHLVPERVDANVGDTLVLHVTNQGSSPHNLMLCGDDAGSASGPGQTCAHPLAGPTKNLGQGESADLPPVVIKSAGKFFYYCTLPGHAQGGMYGELKVAGASEKKSGGEAALGALVALVGVALSLRRR